MTRFVSDLELGPEIGTGFFGVVHEGRDPVHGRVAVKIPRPYPGEPDADWLLRRATLQKEGQNLSRAAHPNIVKVHHLVQSTADDDLHLVMEFCAGGSLQGRYEQGPMPLNEVRQRSTEVALGLQALHSAAPPMLHRDIKPGNVLIDSRGITRLGDFGLVTDDLVLGYGSTAGYKDHLAPEVHHGLGTSVRTDIWALAMTVYRLVHGAEWYNRALPPRTAVPDGGFADTLRWLAHVPKQWRRAIRAALNDDPQNRYQTATEFMNVLARLPTEPIWSCSTEPGRVFWERQTNQRVVKVEWIQRGPRRHDWSAWSEPRGVGRRMTLDGSKDLSHKEADRQLRNYFGATAVRC